MGLAALISPCTPRGQRRKCHLSHSRFLLWVIINTEEAPCCIRSAEGAPCWSKHQSSPHQEILLLCKLLLERGAKHNSLPVVPGPVLSGKRQKVQV